MSSAATGARGTTPVRPADVEAWLAELELTSLEHADRASITSWDLELDGRRRFDLRVTVILDPSLGLFCWAHYAPPFMGVFRKSYRRLLRWNDEFPFAKFSVGDDERPMLAVEVPIETASRDALGLALARIVGIADALFEETKDWLWIGGKAPDESGRVRRNEALLDRFAGDLPELLGQPEPAPGSGVTA